MKSVNACAYVLLGCRAATQRTRLGGAQVGRWQRLQTVPTRYRVGMCCLFGEVHRTAASGTWVGNCVCVVVGA
jgi:hypothetical protein